MKGDSTLTSLHSALKSEIVEKKTVETVQLALVRLQQSRDAITFSLHAQPNEWSTSGIQTTDLLSFLAFSRSDCRFLPPECYVREVATDFDLEAFVQVFPELFRSIRQAESELTACGVYLNHPEGIGFFNDRPSSGEQLSQGETIGDGHRGEQQQTIDRSEDEHFYFALSSLSNRNDRGWTIHYRPKHPPLSQEMLGAFAFLKLWEFPDCPEFGFEPCHFRSILLDNYQQSRFATAGLSVASQFEAHAAHFSHGVRQLLVAEATVQKFGLNILPRAVSSVQPHQPVPARTGATPTVEDRPLVPMDRFDVAISFASTERDLAHALAARVRDAGFIVFYDDFYPEQLWGRDLVRFFDLIYRKNSRFCVPFISKEYALRRWTIKEMQSALARAVDEKGEAYILPIRVDDTEILGLPPTTGYLSLNNRTLDDVAGILINKLRMPSS